MKNISLFLLLLLPALAGPAASLTWQTYTYTTHEKQPVTLTGQTARLTVPEDYAKPDGPKVELMLVRLPATTATAGLPLVYLHGGPGGASEEHFEQPAFRALFDALRTQGDVILFDQRGCGKSTPSLVPAGVPKIGPDSLASRENLLDYLCRISVLVRDRVRQQGHDPRHFTVLESVEDLESIRAALGAAKIRVLGHSYGTQLAQAFVRSHPASADKLVLVGSRGMDTTRKLPAEADEFLGRIAGLARADQTVGAKFPDLLETTRRVLAKADREPVAVLLEDQKDPQKNLTFQVGGYALRFIIAKFYLKDPDNFKYLPKLLDEIDTGRRPWSLTFNVAQIYRSPVSLAWFTTDAASGVTAGRDGLIQSQAATALLGAPVNFPFPDINQVWGMIDLGDAFRTPVRSEVPVLFVAGTLDGITPVAQTKEIMAGFSHARLLTVENGGHDSQLGAPGVAEAIAGFLAGQVPPSSAQLPSVRFMPLVAARN